MAAALSSMLTIPLGAAITADSVFSDRQPVPGGGADNKTYTTEDDSKRDNQPPCSPSVLGLETETQKLSHKIFLAIMFVMVIISTVVISANGLI